VAFSDLTHARGRDMRDCGALKHQGRRGCKLHGLHSLSQRADVCWAVSAQQHPMYADLHGHAKAAAVSLRPIHVDLALQQTAHIRTHTHSQKDVAGQELSQCSSAQGGTRAAGASAHTQPGSAPTSKCPVLEPQVKTPPGYVHSVAGKGECITKSLTLGQT